MYLMDLDSLIDGQASFCWHFRFGVGARFFLGGKAKMNGVGLGIIGRWGTFQAGLSYLYY